MLQYGFFTLHALLRCTLADDTQVNGAALNRSITIWPANEDCAKVKNNPDIQDLTRGATTPNMRNDGLDASLKFAAYWTSHSLAPLSENEHFTYNSLIHVTYDVRANYSESNSIGSIPFRLGGAVPVATTDDAFYKLYSIPFTLENTWRLPRLGRFHVETNVFDAAANFSGYEKHAVDQSDTDLSLSYLGPLDGEIPRRFAPQNPYTIGAGDERMLKSIAATWAPNGESDSTYYDGSGNLDDGDDLPLYKKKSPSTSQRSEGGVMGMPAAGISMVLVGFLFVVFA